VLSALADRDHVVNVSVSQRDHDSTEIALDPLVLPSATIDGLDAFHVSD
jgi:hypothetical protein